MRFGLTVLGLSGLLALAGCDGAKAGSSGPAPAPTAPQEIKAATQAPEWETGQPVAGAHVVALAELLAKSSELSGKPVRIEGTVTGVCQHRGCWVELTDGQTKVIAKSIDHTVAFPRDAVGKRMTIEGALRVGAAPSCGDHASEGSEAHSCPNPEMLVVVQHAELRPGS